MLKTQRKGGGGKRGEEEERGKEIRIARGVAGRDRICWG